MSQEEKEETVAKQGTRQTDIVFKGGAGQATERNRPIAGQQRRLCQRHRGALGLLQVNTSSNIVFETRILW